jgi:hypothetical protein
MNHKIKKLIISLPSVLATLLTTTVASTTTITPLAYGQDFLFGGSPDVPVQIDPEHASPPLIEPSSPSSRTTNMTNTTATQAAVTTQDPDFARFMQTASECANSAAFGSSGATMTQEQCTQYLEQGQEKWCGLAAYDAQKCAQTTRLTAAWNNLLNLSERYGFSDIPSLGELGIDPRPFAP